MTNGGCVCAINSNVFVNRTTFSDSQSAKGGAIYITNSHIEILKSSFNRNYASQHGGAIYFINSNVSLTATNFTGNHAEYEGGALYYKGSEDVTAQIAIHDSTYFNNSAKLFGGSVYLDGRMTTITESVFANNSAELSGGAVYVERGITAISNTTFVFNSANSSGGSIFQAGLSTSLQLKNNHFVSTGKNAGVIGTTIHSQNKAILKNINISMKLSKHDPLDGLQGVLLPKSIISNLTFSCSSNYRVRYNTVHRSGAGAGFAFLHAACIACSKGQYTLLGSSIKFLSSNETVENQAKCQRCPSGGICTKFVVSRDNFWGYVVNNPTTYNGTTLQHQHIAFIPCPEKYCCSAKTKNCTSYNTCNYNREGEICGKCKQSFTLNYFNGECVKQNSDCKITQFWLLLGLFVICQSLFHMYFKWLFGKIKDLFTKLREMLKKRSPPSFFSQSSATLQEEATSHPASSQDLTSLTSTASTSALSQGTDEKDTSSSVYISGVKKILFFFYQTVVLLHVSTPSAKRNWLYPRMRETVALAFNFEFMVDLCPSLKLSVIVREAIQASPVFLSIFALVVVLHIHSRVMDSSKKSSCNQAPVVETKGISFQLRLKLAIVELLLVGYVVITTFSLAMVNCVALNDHHHLYISGETVCYNWWQYVIVAFVITWIGPFGMAVGLGTMLLREKHVQPTTFYYSLGFPSIALLYFLTKFIVFRWRRRKAIPTDFSSQIDSNASETFPLRENQFDRQDDENGSQTGSLTLVEELEEEDTADTVPLTSAGSTEAAKIDADVQGIDNERKEILEIFQLPYKQETANMETVIIYTRLALTSITTLTINPVPRLLLTFPTLLAFLIYHDLYTPFTNKLLNHLQRASIISILLLNLINLAWAYDYMNDISSMPGWTLISHILSIVQGIIVLLPSVGIVVLFLLRFIGKLAVKQCHKKDLMSTMDEITVDV